MELTERVHALKIPFSIEFAPGRFLERFVYAYLIYGKSIVLIDCGVSSSSRIILDYLEGAGRDPGEIDMIVITHAHPDHIGGAVEIKKASGGMIAAHEGDRPWIEDVALQQRERPVPGFTNLVSGPVEVDRLLSDGDRIEAGEGQALEVIHTPGHSRGHISLLLKGEGVLFAGDSLPLPGTIPIYEDAPASAASIQRLKGIKDLKVLLSSWDEPRYGDEINETFEAAIGYLRDVHRTVLRKRADDPSADMPALAGEVLRILGLPEGAMNPLFFNSIKAHLRASGHTDLLKADQ